MSSHPNPAAPSYGREADLVADAHDHAMSSDPVEACYGRLCKELTPLMLRLINREADRLTPSAVLLFAAAKASTGLATTVAANCAKPADVPDVCRTLSDLMQSNMAEIARTLPAHPDAPLQAAPRSEDLQRFLVDTLSADVAAVGPWSTALREEIVALVNRRIEEWRGTGATRHVARSAVMSALTAAVSSLIVTQFECEEHQNVSERMARHITQLVPVLCAGRGR